MPLSFYLIGKDKKILELDNGGASSGNTGYLTSIGFEHHKIHEGEHYTCSDYDSDVDSTNKDWLVRAPASGSVHTTFEIEASKNGLVEVYEAPTTSADGTPLTCYNNDRNSSNTPTLLVFKDPTVSGTGTTRLGVLVMGSDGANPVGDRGGKSERGKEVILKVSTDYLLRFTALNDNTRVSMDLEFYEVS